MEDTTYNKKALILGVQKCLTEWLKGHSYVCCDAQLLLNAWTSFHTRDETTMKMFYWLHQHGRLEQSLPFEIQTVLNRRTVIGVTNEVIANFNYPPMDFICQFLQKWADDRIIALQNIVDEKKNIMTSWSIFDLHNDHILRAYANVFASGNITDVAKFEEQIFVNRAIILEGWTMKIHDDVETNDEIPSIESIVDKVSNIRDKPIDTEVVEISDDNVKKLFSDFLTKMEKKNEQLKRYFQCDDKIRLEEDDIKTKPALVVLKPVDPKVFGIETRDMASRTGKSEETEQIPVSEQNVDAHQNRLYSEVAKPEEKKEEKTEVSEKKIQAACSPKAGKQRSIFQLPTEGSAEVPKVDEWVKARKFSRRELDPSRIREALDIAKYLEEPLKEEATKDVVPDETSSFPKPAKVRLTPQQMKAANTKKKNDEQSEKFQRDCEDNEAFKIAHTKKVRWFQDKNFEYYGLIFQHMLEDHQKTSQNLTDDLARKLATRFIEKRIEVLSQSSKIDETRPQLSISLYYYKLLLKKGADTFEKEILEKLCMLNRNYKDAKFEGLECVFLSDKLLSDKMKEHINENVERIADDQVAASQVYDMLFIKYISSDKNFLREVSQIKAKTFLETRIRSLSEAVQGSSNDSNTLEIYQAVNSMDFATISLELLQQIGTLDTVKNNPGFRYLESILVDNLKAII